MADSDSGGSATPWLAFLVGIVLVGLLVVGFFAFTGTTPQNEIAEVTTPNIEINPPDINLPEINPPEIQPPAANVPEPAAPAPAQ